VSATRGQSRIVVADLQDDLAPAEALRLRIEAAWPGPERHPFAAAPASALQRADLDEAMALVLLAPQDADEARVLTFLALAEEAGVPVVAILPAPPPPGNCWEFGEALVMPRQTEERVVAAALWGLVHRQVQVRRLRAEVDLAQRFHGGLRGEISRMHDELQLAAMVQREFLPREFPEVAGIRFAAMWRPTNYVSGDIYDVLRLGEDQVGLFVADASGHGVPAALTTMFISRSLCASEIAGPAHRVVPPAEVLRRLNIDMLRRQGNGSRFATAVYAVMDCRSRRLVLSGAGHPPPLLLRPDGATRVLKTGGGLLGVFPDESYDEVEIDLEPGDILLLYSDGFEQAFPEGGARSRVTMRYLQEFEELRGADSPWDMIEQMGGRLDSQLGSLHQADDVTLLCMHVGPPADQPVAPRSSQLTTTLAT
jgi:sigma-B regulation protein RsbU (phosphoserine phosphatase)